MSYKNYRTELPSFLCLLILLSLFNFGRSASQTVNWPHITEIKSGDHKLLLQPITASPFTYSQPFGTGYSFSSSPNVVLAMRSLMISATNQSIDFQLSVGSATTSSFVTTVSAPNGLPITLLYYMYIAMSKTYAYNYFISYSQDLTSQLNGSLSLGTTTLTKTTNASISRVSSARVMPYIISFGMGANSTEYSVAATGTMTNSSSFSIQITSNSSLYRVELMVIVVDAYAYQDGYINFLDYGYLQQFNSGASFSYDYNPPSTDYYNSVSGVTFIRLPRDKAISFYLTATNRYNTTTAFTQVKIEVLQWRLRQCVNSTMPYYAQPEQLCYDSCSNSTLYTYGQNNTKFFCVKCDTSCTTCAGDGTSCTSCNSLLNRQLNNSTSKCDCLTGYFEGGFQGCSSCDYSCLTCQTASTTCTSCVSARLLTNASCPCKVGTYENIAGNASCAACDYRCLTCQGVSTNCSSCSSSFNRLFDSENQKCPCASGFVDDGNTTCATVSLTCTLPCITCSNSATNCTSCDATKTRTLSNSQCLCQTGYYASSTTDCTEICGDGKLLTSTYQCDDGNTVSGDGCSSVCMIESGFSCVNSNSTTPASTCVSSAGYTISSQKPLRDTASNQMTASITFSPSPPSTIVPSLLSLQNQLSITSYSLSSNILTVTLAILQETTADSLSIGLSVINQTASVPLETSNRLEVKPYSNFQLSVYSVETYLVWVLIGLLWVGSIIFVGCVQVNSFGGVFQLFFFMGLAWVGVEGQQLYGILFLPLRNLKYIFGPNLQLGNRQNLFYYFNIGCIIFLLPLITFAVIVLINKKKAYCVSTKVKRFALFDLLYCWMMVNGLLIAFGVGSTTYLSPLGGVDIGGMVFGTVYILTCIGFSWRLFGKKQEVQINPKLEVTKKNLFRPRWYSLSLCGYLMVSLVYICIQRKSKVSALLMMGWLLFMLLFNGLGNMLINKARHIINLILLLLVYASILLFANVSSAVWSGLAVMILLYVQLALNFTFLVLEKNKRAISSEMASEQAKIAQQVNRMIDMEREPEFDQLEQSQNNKSALAGQYENHFTVYEPTVKKPPLEIMVPAPEMLYETNAIETAMKTYSGKERERLLLDKRNRMMGSRQASELQQQMAEVAARKVDMHAI